MATLSPENQLSEIDQLIGRFAQAEYQIVKAYFDTPGFRDEQRDYQAWRLQQAKENLRERDLSNLPRMNQQLRADGLGYDQIRAMLHKMEEEYLHSQLFAQLAQRISGKIEGPNMELLQGPHRAIEQARYWVIDNLGQELGEAVIDASETGRGVMFLALSEVREGPYAADIAETGRVVYMQEIPHFQDGVAGLRRLAPSVSSSQWGVMMKFFEETGVYRVKMRNDQFSYPLSDDQINKLIAQVQEKTIEPFVARPLSLYRG